MAVFAINMATGMASGWVVAGGAIIRSSKLQLPVADLDLALDVILDNTDLAFLRESARASYELTKSLLLKSSNVSYCWLLRKNQVRQMLMSDIRKLFSGKNISHKLTLGLFDIAFDSRIFGISPFETNSKTYKLQDFHLLDELLGLGWDLSDTLPQQYVQFVTISVNEELVYSGSIRKSTNTDAVVDKHSDYRNKLEAHNKAVALGF